MLGITEVIENLYISGLESRQAILNKGIRSVINISSECPIQDLGPAVEYEKVSILDVPSTSIQPYFDRLTDQIHQNLQQGKKTLVHCYVGRSRSATIILAYLMKYKQMPLRDAFQYLRSRRHIVGPNFGFIKQLIAYERSLFGYTTVSFVNTSFGSVPDIYISVPTSRSRRLSPSPSPPPRPMPMTTTSTLGRARSSPKPTLSFAPTRSTSSYSSSPFISLPIRQNSSVQRPTTSASPTRSVAISNYSNAYNHGASNNPYPVSTSSVQPNSYSKLGSNIYQNSSFIRQQPDQSRWNFTSTTRPNDITREFLIPSKTNTFGTIKYVPSSYNRYHLP